MKVTLPSKVASKQASKILIERQMVLLRVWLPTKKKVKKKKKERKKGRAMLLKPAAKSSGDYKYVCPVVTASSAGRATADMTQTCLHPVLLHPPLDKTVPTKPQKQHEHALGSVLRE